MEAGYALAHERAKALQELAAILFCEITDKEYRWPRDVKIVGRGEAMQAVDVVRFNHHEVEQFRGILDDIAKELGERRHRQEHSGLGGGPIQYEHTVDSAALRAAEDAYLAALGGQPTDLGLREDDDSPPNQGPDTL